MNKKYINLFVINDINQLSSLGKKDSNYVIVANRGIFSYSTTTSAVDYTGSIDGGYWNNILPSSGSINQDDLLQDGYSNIIQDGYSNYISIGSIEFLTGFNISDFQTTDFI